MTTISIQENAALMAATAQQTLRQMQRMEAAGHEVSAHAVAELEVINEQLSELHKQLLKLQADYVPPWI